MRIREASEKDLPRIMEIYAHARKFMAEHGNPNQWGPTNWPPEALIRKDIENKESFVCEEDGRIVAVFYYAYGERIEPAYDKIYGGKWRGSETYGVVHRIASDGTVKGAGSFCVRWALEKCGHLRMDTHGDNHVMQSMLGKLGFVHCGTIYVPEDSYPRLAYEIIKGQIKRQHGEEH